VLTVTWLSISSALASSPKDVLNSTVFNVLLLLVLLLLLLLLLLPPLPLLLPQLTLLLMLLLPLLLLLLTPGFIFENLHSVLKS